MYNSSCIFQFRLNSLALIDFFCFSSRDNRKNAKQSGGDSLAEVDDQDENTEDRRGVAQENKVRRTSVHREKTTGNTSLRFASLSRSTLR